MGRISFWITIDLKKYFVGPMNWILILLLKYIQEGLGNCGELEGFGHLGFHETSRRATIVYVTSLRVYK